MQTRLYKTRGWDCAVRYETIFFDLDHTLIDTKKQYTIGIPMTVKRVYGDSAPKEFEQLFYMHHQQLWPEYDARRITMEDLRRERFLRAWRDLGVERSHEDADVFQREYSSTFGDTVYTYPGTFELLDALRGAYRFGIITNGSPDIQWQKMKIAGLDVYFREESVIISENIGMAKPHHSVYDFACRALGVKPASALMIGDNYRADVLGARQFGMDAVWYVPDLEYIPKEMPSGEKPIRQWEALVASVTELCSR